MSNMNGDVTTQDLTQTPATILVNLINAQNLIYLPTALTVEKAIFADPESFGGQGANSVVRTSTTDPATYGAGSVDIHYTRADLSTLPAQQAALTGNSPTTVNGTISTTGTGLATAFSGSGVILAANDLVIIVPNQGGVGMAAATYATGDDFASAISSTAGIEGFATFNSSTNEIDFVNPLDGDVIFSPAFATQAYGLGFPPTVPAAVTSINYTVADVIAVLNTLYSLNLAADNITQDVATNLVANENGTYSQQITAAAGDLIYMGTQIFVFDAVPGVVTANFGKSVDHLEISFTDLSTTSEGDTIVAWAWAFGDGGTSAVQNPVYTYHAVGTYSVTLVATDSTGSSGSKSVNVTAVGQPTAAFTSNVNGLTVSFTDASTDIGGATIASWSWDFGDSSALVTTQNPTHTYSTAGNHTVALTVTDSTGQTATVSHVVVASGLPTASFSSSVSGQTVTFTDLSSEISGATITGWAWTFGDGDTATTQNPVHAYASAGTFTVALTVTDSTGATNATSGSVETVGTPIASFTVVSTDLDATFTDTSTDVPGAAITGWLWDFGDGEGTSTEQNPTYSYPYPDNFAVTLTVTDATGQTDGFNGEADINLPPHALFSVTRNYLEITFADASYEDGYAEINAWSWDFGDGSEASTEQNPVHTYEAAGTYAVVLTVSDNIGHTTVGDPVNVEVVASGPQVDFTQIQNQLQVTFTDATIDDDDATITGWAWTFGDGTGTSTDQNPVYTYADYGTYTVTLEVTDSSSRTAQTSKTFHFFHQA